ncbi:glutathione S-transferase family protein [Poseidonocella sp. HB161398]|uniref:glutathione S-transferase family protein n=1 Tax=Poseidonocella sp. HB161398 TaxID=2320855 RepID=UPI00110997E2|nr:glutathione S-transferase family protein [Poseidonocella sp. HB161398]
MTLPDRPIKLYWHEKSGHAHRAQLMLSLLGLPCETIRIDLAARAQKAPDYLAISPFGQIPAIEDGGTVLWDSCAILVYLAKRYGGDGGWLPEDPAGAAEVQRWLSVAAGPLAAGPAAARRAVVFLRSGGDETAKAAAHALLEVVEAALAERDYLAGAAPTIADVAGYTYIAHAPEGGVSLDPYPAIRAWLARIEALPGFTPMAASPVPA